MKETLDQLKKDILARHKSLHAFCRNTPEVARSSVYALFSGKYAGNAANLTRNIRAVMGGTCQPEPMQQILTADEAYTVLQEAKCTHCRKRDKFACSECRTQTTREARALEEYLRSREV